MGRRQLALAACAILIAPAPVVGDDALDSLLQRAASYVSAYERDFATVLGEEDYEQRLLTPEGRLRRRRRLRSEIAFVRVLDSDVWFGYRNVLQVDGRAVRDSERRLERLFRDAPRDVAAQAKRILDEASRYNLGRLQRNFNLPMVPLMFLRADVQPRFWFSAIGAARRDDPSVTRIAYRELATPTLIRAVQGNAAAFGTLEVRDDGAVLDSTLAIRYGVVQIDIGVHYAPDAALGLLVPREMTESYLTLGRDGERISCTATYSAFRRFQTTARIVSQPH